MSEPESQNALSLEDSASTLFDESRQPARSRLGREWSSQGGRARVWGLEASNSHSLYLRRYFLVGIALLLLLFVVSLEILNSISNRNQGFAPAPGGMHYYLWTYGPAIVLTIVAAVWAQLEYRIQMSVPWTELARKPLPAAENLLLNYVTQWNVKSLFRSLSAGHYAVALGIAGSIVSRVLLVVSTGLFVSEIKQLTLETELRMIDQFNLGLNAGDLSDSIADTGVALWAITQEGVPYRPGATPEHAALSFITPDIVDLGPDATLTANVSVFSVDQECDAFSWTFPTRKKLFPLADIMSQSDLDRLSPFSFCGLPYLYHPDPSVAGNLSSSYINYTALVDLVCPNITSDSRPLSDSFGIFTSIGLDLPSNLTKVSALLCHPKYSLTRREVTTSWGNSTGGDVLDISSNILEDMDLGASPFTLTNDIFGSMMAYEDAYDGRNRELRFGNGTGLLPFWVGLMNMTTPQSNWEAFFNTTLLSAAFQRTFRTIAALTVKYTKTAPATETEKVRGRIIHEQPRLVVSTVSLRVMETLLGLLSLIALSLCLSRFKPLSQQPPSLMATAVILSASKQLAEVLSKDRVPRMETVATQLRGYLFSSSPSLQTVQAQNDPHFDDCQMAHEETPLHDAGHPIPRWWRPTAATKTFRISLIIITLLLFASLEVVYQISNKHGGLVDVFKEGYARYIWLYLPPFSMACLGLAYGAMDTAVRTLHPYSELSRGSEGNGDAMEFDSRSSTSLFAVAQSLRRRSFGLSAVISTSILAGLLTIAASGLYSTTESAQKTENSALGLESWFDIESASQLEGSYTGRLYLPDTLISQAIQFNNLSYPAGTYRGVAFAMPDTGRLGAYHNTSTSPATLKARIPAAQTQANCSLYRFWDAIQLEPNQSTYSFVLHVEPPPGCKRGHTHALSDDRYIELMHSAGLTPPPGYFGFVSMLGWKLLPEAYDGGKFSPDNRDPYTVCSDNTQHLFMVYGRRIDLTMHNVTVLHCLPFVQAIEVEADFTLPALTVDDTKDPPRAAGPAIPWNSTNPSMNSIPLPVVAAKVNNGTDPFFTVLTRGGPDATPLDTLTGRDRIPAMIDRVNTVYAQLGAQSLHFNFRRPTANLTAANATNGRPPPGSGSIQATISVPAPPGYARLVQTQLSTRLLQGLLLCLAACAAMSFWVLRGSERILPADPGSIAARMGLLAGSEMVEILRREGVEGLEGRRFGLGWWERIPEEGGEDGVEEGKEGRWRYGIDVILTPSTEQKERGGWYA